MVSQLCLVVVYEVLTENYSINVLIVVGLGTPDLTTLTGDQSSTSVSPTVYCFLPTSVTL